MARILGRSDAGPLLDGKVDPAKWTALIPAAGRGTRLGFDKPKILFPVGGATILDRLISLLLPLCQEFVFVLSPEGSPIVEPEIRQRLGTRGSIALQPSPRGMGDAVACGLPQVSTPNVAVIWGDQCALKSPSLDFCMRLLQGQARPAAVCPTLLRQRPYIHFERDQCDVVMRVLQEREGDSLPSHGESDSGVFFFRTNAVRRYLSDLLQDGHGIGRSTGEWNFLPVFPLIDAVPGQLFTPRIMSDEESVGVNSRADVQYLVGRGC